jgi:hypothetical protein
VRKIAEKSYAFQETAQRIEDLRKEKVGFEGDIGRAIADSGSELTIGDVRGFERLTSARRRLDERLPATRAELRHRWLAENVQPGRIITQGRSGKRLFMVISVHGDSVSAMRDDGQGRNLPIDRVNRVYQKTYKLNDAAIEGAFFEVLEGKNPSIPEPKPAFNRTSVEAAALLDGLINGFGPGLELMWEIAKMASSIESIERDIVFLRSEIWMPFENRARVLDHFGYLDLAAEKVTESGKWLADVRVDRPLLVGEAIRNGIFDEISTKAMAGLMASLAADSERNYGDLYLSDQLLNMITQFEEVIYDVSRIEWRSGVEPAEEINLSAAAAAERWAGGLTWDDLVKRTKAEEGDLVRLLSRTGEALMQVANLRDSNSSAAAAARTAAEVVLREPIR